MAGPAAEEADDPAIAVRIRGVTKTYGIWSSPKARLAHPVMTLAAQVVPFSRLARAVGVALMASGPLFLLGVVMAAAPTPVLYLTAAASALDVLIGLVLFTGARHVEVDRESRQLRFGATVLGLALPATGQQIPVDAQAKLIVSAAHRERATHDVSLEQHGQRARVLSFAKRDQAQRYAQQLADALRIAVITMDAGTGDGSLLDVLAPVFDHVVAVDRSDARVAQALCEAVRAGLDGKAVEADFVPHLEAAFDPELIRKMLTELRCQIVKPTLRPEARIIEVVRPSA